MSTYSTFAASGGGGATSGGETITCNGTTVSLTSDNSSSLSICFNQTGCVCLPNATTLDEGSALYTIKNLSTNNSVLLHDHCCNLYNFIKPFESIQISLHDSSTAQGGWTFQKPLTNLENLAIDSNYSFPTGFSRSDMDQVAHEGTYQMCNGKGNSDLGQYFLGVKGNCVFTGIAKYNTTSKSYEPMAVQKCCLTGETTLNIKSFTSFYHGGAVGFLCSGQHVGISCTGTACLYCEDDSTWCTSCLCNLNNNNYGYVTDCLSTFATMLPKTGENACQKLRLMHICAVTGKITCLCEVTDTISNELSNGVNSQRLGPVFELTRHYHHFFGTKTCRITSIKWMNGATENNGSNHCIKSECVWIYVPCYLVTGFKHFSAFNPCALNGSNENGQFMAPYLQTSSNGCRRLASFTAACKSGTIQFAGDPCRFIYQYLYCNGNNDEGFFAKIVQYTGSAFCSEYIHPTHQKQCVGMQANTQDNSMAFSLVHDCFLYVQRVQNNCAPSFRSLCGGELIHLCWGTSPCACTRCTGICCTSGQHCGAAQCDLWNQYLRTFSHRQYGKGVSSDFVRENAYIRLCNSMFYDCVDSGTGKSTRPNCVHYFNTIFSSCGNGSGYFSGMNMAYRCDECGFCIFYPRCRDGSTARWNYMCGCGTAMGRLQCCFVNSCCWHASPSCCSTAYEAYGGNEGVPDNRAVVLQFTPGTSGQTAKVDVVNNLFGFTFCVVGGTHTCDGKGWGLSHGSAGCTCGFCDLQWIDCCNEHFIQGSITSNQFRIGLAKICRDGNYCIKHCNHICIREGCCYSVEVNDSKCNCHHNFYPSQLTSPTTGFIISHSHPCGGFNSSLAIHKWEYDSVPNVYKFKTDTVYRLEDTFVCNLIKGSCIDQTDFAIITCQSSGSARELKSFAFYDACR